MSLTKNDLSKIQEMIDLSLSRGLESFFTRLMPIFNQFATKADLKDLESRVASKERLNEVNDDLAGLHLKFDRTYTLLKHQVDLNTEDLKLVKKHLRI